MNEHVGIPVSGDRAQSIRAAGLMNINKNAEEHMLRLIDHYATDPNVDKCWLAIGRTQMEQAWMAINRAILKPDRLKVDGDS